MDTSIINWMEKFKAAWLAKDIDGVFALLSEDIEYWETPYQVLHKQDPALRSAWEEVLPLEEMRLTYEIYSSNEQKRTHAITWQFTHSQRESAGVYLVTLDEQGLCKYFYHCAVPKEV